MLFSLFVAILTLDLRLYSLLGFCLCPGLLAGGAPLTIQCWPANTIVNDLYSTLYLYLYLSLYLCWTLSLPAPSLLLLAIQCWPANGTVINLAQPEQQERGRAQTFWKTLLFPNAYWKCSQTFFSFTKKYHRGHTTPFEWKTWEAQSYENNIFISMRIKTRECL